MEGLSFSRHYHSFVIDVFACDSFCSITFFGLFELTIFS